MRYRRILPFLALSLGIACSSLAAPTPKPVDVGRVARVVVYWNGGERVLESEDEKFAELAKHLLDTLTNFNLQAQCVFGEHQISAMKRQDRLVELLFKAPERVTIGERVPREDREWIPADEQGFRVLEARGALFVVSGEYEGHVLLPAEGEPPAWGCWAIERKKEIDRSWIKAVHEAIEEQDLP